jgi:two-component system, chemotaxis family, response regulator Rcp1
MKQLPQVLLVDDNPADVVLAREALAGGKHQSRISNVEDGEEVLAFLHRIGRHADAVRPVLAILDLNLPKKDGRAVLAEAKADKTLRTIPVVVFSASCSTLDLARSYELGANCYVHKPGNPPALRRPRVSGGGDALAGIARSEPSRQPWRGHLSADQGEGSERAGCDPFRSR